MASQDVAQLLIRFGEGDKAALDEMTPLVYDELRRLAQRLLAAERPDHTLQPTALVHEAYMRLVGQRSVDWRNRAHFLGVAATMMRRVLINHAKARNAAKREGFANAITLEDAFGIFPVPAIDVLALNHSLDELSKLDPQQGKVVEMRYFGGLSIEETAECLGISAATVKREWGTARLWLLEHMEGTSQS